MHVSDGLELALVLASIPLAFLLPVAIKLIIRPARYEKRVYLVAVAIILLIAWWLESIALFLTFGMFSLCFFFTHDIGKGRT